MDILDIYKNIEKEYLKAIIKHPYWPDDIIYSVSIMNEESGESIRAALNHIYEDGTKEEIIKEVTQTAAMCVRILVNIND